MSMPFPIQIDILDFIFKGILIGIIASAPMGPVGILCVQRTLNKGRWYGFVTGIGAAISDFIYALIVGLGMSFIMEPLQNPEYQFFLQIVGSIVLLFFGIYCFISNPARKLHKSGKTKGTLFHNGFTAFLVTFSNPLIILLLMAVYAQFAFVQPSRPFEMIVGFACIPIGALVWWYGLTWLVNKIRAIFDVNGIVIINKVIGSLVVLFSLIMLIGTLFNLYHLPSYY
ncbi:lysine transporter LysE [Prevotella brunnea]|uniref:Lysine transporter LysE n=2 Tax=Prevotella brunnea TaxID=2508867 RepID=A0A5C8GMA1_9BACT|nr:LysE family transporter [Prevotella brunnea]MDR0186173.1 lysine transporter LysE [Prevotella brunnea]TXJ63291.1 lysine transporter LysE [Prevotella brunnea]